MRALEQRFRDQRQVFGLPRHWPGRRWVSRDGGPDDLALAHGEPRPHSSPLIVVGMMLTRYGENSRVDVHNTLGTMLMLEECSRNDAAFQHATRDQAVIDRELASIPGPDVWRPSEIDVDGVARPFARLDRGEDWIAFCDLEAECIYVHAQQPDGLSISVVTITDFTPYEELDGS